MPKTDVRAFFEGRFLGAWDVEDGADVVLTIERCEGQVIKGEKGKEDKCPVLYFRAKTKKGMVLNKTNTKTLIKLFGRFIEEWPGKRIAIYATTTEVGGEVRDCLRIRPNEPIAPARGISEKAGEEAPA